jgi:alpha-tubulin suppressor-like RCC1 family protein
LYNVYLNLCFTALSCQILDIAAGGWMSAAISAFGDLYVWGWNSNGQLGLRVSDLNPTVYALPQIVEFPGEELSVESVACGTRHTLVRTCNNKYYVTGSNKYGQLGVDGVENITWKQGYDKEDVYIDQFTEICGVEGDFIVSCGYWSSLLFEK